METKVRLRCFMKTQPGMYAQYDGYVEVMCQENAEWDEIFNAAFRKLKTTAFPDHASSLWTMTRMKS